MKRDIPTKAGLGFTVLIAAAPLAVPVVAGIFLIYQSETNAQLRTPHRVQITLAGPSANRNPSPPVQDVVVADLNFNERNSLPARF